MINWIIKRYGGLKPVQIDGFLYVLIAVCAFVEETLRSNDVYKYMNPYAVFYGGLIIGTIGAGGLALKMFRSTTYSDHLDATKAAEAALLPDGTTTQQQTTKVETINEKVTNPIP